MISFFDFQFETYMFLPEHPKRFDATIHGVQAECLMKWMPQGWGGQWVAEGCGRVFCFCWRKVVSLGKAKGEAWSTRRNQYIFLCPLPLSGDSNLTETGLHRIKQPPTKRECLFFLPTIISWDCFFKNTVWSMPPWHQDGASCVGKCRASGRGSLVTVMEHRSRQTKKWSAGIYRISKWFGAFSITYFNLFQSFTDVLGGICVISSKKSRKPSSLGVHLWMLPCNFGYIWDK